MLDKQKNKRQQAFSLIELLVVIALLFVLAALAIGRYDSFLHEQSRLLAQSELLAIAAFAEAQFAQTRSYASVVLDEQAITPTARKSYKFSLTTTTDSFVATATPFGVQTGNGALSINHTGEQRWYISDVTIGEYRPW